MALPSSGSLLWSQVCAEFGVPVSTPISAMHRGGPHVPNIPQNANIPTSGAIDFPNDFYGASNQAPFSISAGNASGTVFLAEPAPSSALVSAGTTVSFSGGTGAGRTVSFARVSGDASIALVDSGTSPRWESTVDKHMIKTAVWRATGRDNGGNVDTFDITVTLRYRTNA